MTRVLLSLIVTIAFVAGCASAPPPPQPHGRGAASPRVRCLANPNDTELRPLFFLFCAESP